MLDPILNGILLGFIVALLIGPVFFLIINTSLHRGFKYAAQVATGVMLSDALFIFVAYFGSSIVLVINNHRQFAGIIASIIILIFGLGILFKKQTIPAEAIQMNEKVKGAWLFVAKGFMLNSMNPSVLFFWIGVSGTVSLKSDYTATHLMVFYGIILITVFGTDLLKAYVAQRIKQFVTADFLLWLNRVTGVALIIFAIVTFFKSI